MRISRSFAVALSLLLALPATAHAQTADPATLDAQRDAMDALKWMHGSWRGDAVIRGPQGEMHIIQTERVGPMLGGTLTVIEGKGFLPDGSVGFNAFAVISYDPKEDAYTMRSYAQGNAGTFTITPTDDGYVWEIPAGPATIRYVATIRDGVWSETGEYVMLGQPPRRFIEMSLTRVGDSDWPAAGAMTME